MVRFFDKFAKFASDVVRNAWTFTSMVVLVLLWIISGPIFHYSELWQLLINTITTVITFLIVFLLQHTQNRESAAVNLKLDELIAVHKRTKNTMINLEDLSDEELKELEQRFKRFAYHHQTGQKKPHDI